MILYVRNKREIRNYLEEIESKFRAHRKTTTHGVGKRWPEELKELLRQAHVQGFSLRRLSLVSQVHQEILKRWLVQDSEGKSSHP